jgi:hypothetical protein
MAPLDMAIFFLEISMMLFIVLLYGHVISSLHFPVVLGELFGGIILSPTVFGWLSPSNYRWSFPTAGAVFESRDALIQICKKDLGSFSRRKKYSKSKSSTVFCILP